MKIGRTLLCGAGLASPVTSVVNAGEAAPAKSEPVAPPRNFVIPDQGKLLLTAGFNDADGTGGGGLVPFALITGYGSKDSYGVNAHYTYAPLRDFHLKTYGVGVGLLLLIGRIFPTSEGIRKPPLRMQNKKASAAYAAEALNK